MKIYAGLDVSDKPTHICVVDSDGTVLRRDVVASDPDVLPIERCQTASATARGFCNAHTQAESLQKPTHLIGYRMEAPFE